MTSIKKLILLVSAFLGVFFYTSSVSAFTASDGKEYTIVNGGNTTWYRVFKNGFLFLDYYPLFGYNQADPTYYPTKGIFLFDKLWDTSISLYKWSPTYTTQNSLWIVDHSTNSLQCFYKAGSANWDKFVNSIATIQHKGNYIKFLTSTGSTAGFLDMGCWQITQAEVDALPPYVPSTPACSSDNILTGWNCSCSPTGEYFISGATTPLTFTWWGKTLDPANIKTNSTYRFSANKAKSYTVSYDEGTWKPDPNLINIDVSSFGGSTVNHVILWSSTGQLSTDSSMVQWTNSLVDFKEIDQYIKVTVSGENSKENLFNSIYINSSTGVTFPTLVTHRFAVYYASMELSWGAAAEANLNPWADQDWKYVGDYWYNTRIDLPYGSNARYLKIVPLQTASYVKAISLFNVPYEQEVSCKIVTDEEKQVIISGSGTTLIDSINLCWQIPIDIPVIWSAINSLCPYFEPVFKPVVAKIWPFLNFIYLPPPSTPPTAFNFFPKVTMSDGTWTLGTQTWWVLFSTGQTNISKFKVVSDDSNQWVKKWVLAVVAILLYAVLLALHALVIYATFMFFLMIHRFLDGIFWVSHQGNLISSLPFLGYIALLFTTVLSVLTFFSFLLPILDFTKQFFLWIIVNITAFADGSYTLFHWFYALIFGGILIVPLIYLLYILIQKFGRLN